MPFSWDANRVRYRDTETGRFVAVKQVAALAQASLEETGQIVDDLAPSEIRSVLRAEIKKETIRQYLLGRGGVNQMKPRDWGIVGSRIAEQYSYLDAFVAELDKLSEAQIASRVRMYILSAHQGFERGKAEAVRVSGEYSEEHWVVDESRENCTDCLALAARGWVTIGELATFPGAGDTQCLTNCGCTIEYR